MNIRILRTSTLIKAAFDSFETQAHFAKPNAIASHKAVFFFKVTQPSATIKDWKHFDVISNN
jgi:hypothetical protein